jgi:transcriptional antiterminator NusG
VDKKWYTVRVMSGQENKVKQTIESELEIAGLGKFVEEIVVPSERIIEMKDGKKKEKNRIFFPGYLLIEMEMEEAARFAIVNTTGVINFVGSQNRPSPLQKTR